VTNGNVGIGASTPTEKLEVSGNVKATNFISTSDRRLKENIQPTKGLEVINQLTGVSWDWKSNHQPDAGVIAQDLEKVIPSAVVTNEETGLKAVKYNTLVAPLIQAVKELYVMIKNNLIQDQAQDSAIAALQKDNEKLKSENEKLKKDMEMIKSRLGLQD
jgi:hypothetical protein